MKVCAWLNYTAPAAGGSDRWGKLFFEMIERAVQVWSAATCRRLPKAQTRLRTPYRCFRKISGQANFAVISGS
jgi:hypothetical protein